MLRYLLKRVALFLPTLVVISLLAFGLSKITPGDPVLSCYAPPEAGGGDMASDFYYNEKIYTQIAQRMGLDKPVFYFSLKASAFPDSLYQIGRKEDRRLLRKLTAQYGNWEQVDQYHKQLKSYFLYLFEIPDSIAPRKVLSIRKSIQQLQIKYRAPQIESLLAKIDQTLTEDSLLNETLAVQQQTLKQTYANLEAQQSRYKLYIPDFAWYGFDNQYHNWISKFMVGDFGISCKDDQPVLQKLKPALFWTLLLNGTAILIAYGISIPLGVYSATQKNTWKDRIISVVLFMLYALPSFWIATLCVIFFTNSEYGMDWFPSHGLGSLPSSAPFWSRFRETAWHFVLPVFCMTYGSLAFISRQMRGGMIDVLRADFIRTAWAKGLNKRQVVWKHAFRNALFPIITLFASIFPLAFAGSLVIELIFSIPGMGRLTITSIYGRDWPVVYAILMLAALLTMLGILIADLLYAWVDPRVKFNKTNS